MIPKVHYRGISPDWLLPYLFSPNNGQHRNPRVIAAWAYATGGDLTELQPAAGTTGRPAVRHLMNLLEQPVRAGINPPAKYVWHCSVHNYPSDPLLSDQQWQHIATEIMAEVGLAPAGDLNAVRWIAIRHATNHVHILATVVRQDGRAAWTRQDYRQTHTACRRLERHYGLHQVGTRPPTTVRPKPRELWKANRERRSEVPRDRLRREVRAIAATVSNEPAFFD